MSCGNPTAKSVPFERIKLMRGEGYVVQDHVFTLNTRKIRAGNEVMYLKCNERSLQKCPARVKIEQNQAFIILPDHNHDPPSIEALKFRAAVLEDAKSISDAEADLANVYADRLDEYLQLAKNPTQFLNSVPSFTSIKLSVFRATRSKGAASASAGAHADIDESSVKPLCTDLLVVDGIPTS